MFINIKWKFFFRTVTLFTFLSLIFAFSTNNTQIMPESNEVFSSNNHEQILIIDAGHGGMDGGAVGNDGTLESVINLEIALKLRDLAVFCGENVLMTRVSEDIDYPDPNASIALKKVTEQKQRVELINSIPNAWLISIHQNTYIDNSVNGAQVFFRKTDNSETIAKAMQENLNSKLFENSRRLSTQISDSVYLMKSVKCDAVLVECGFLTNNNDLNNLKSDDFQTKLAMVIFSSWSEIA